MRWEKLQMEEKYEENSYYVRDIQEIKQHNTQFWIKKLFKIFSCPSRWSFFLLNERNNVAG